MNIDEKYMARALQLGLNAMGLSTPNPMVGAVIVHSDEIIGEGYTSPFGGAHAEVNAIRSVKDTSLLKDATLYVTLEPCSHYGKTPPCADLIVANGLQKVVIGITDPNPMVAGKGIEKLKAGGIQVEVGVLEKSCRDHHRRFLTFQEKKRPYIVLKWAESRDGFIAPKETDRAVHPQPYWISNGYSRQLAHKWRTEEQGILVGTGTVLADDPELTARDWHGHHPIRVVLDRSLDVPGNFKVMQGSTKTMVFTQTSTKEEMSHPLLQYHELSGMSAQDLCDALYKHGIVSCMVEGGAKTLQRFIADGLWDEARIIKGPKHFGTGLKAPKITGRPVVFKKILDDTLTILRHDQEYNP